MEKRTDKLVKGIVVLAVFLISCSYIGAYGQGIWDYFKGVKVSTDGQSGFSFFGYGGLGILAGLLSFPLVYFFTKKGFYVTILASSIIYASFLVMAYYYFTGSGLNFLETLISLQIHPFLSVFCLILMLYSPGAFFGVLNQFLLLMPLLVVFGLVYFLAWLFSLTKRNV